MEGPAFVPRLPASRPIKTENKKALLANMDEIAKSIRKGVRLGAWNECEWDLEESE